MSIVNNVVIDATTQFGRKFGRDFSLVRIVNNSGYFYFSEDWLKSGSTFSVSELKEYMLTEKQHKKHIRKKKLGQINENI